MTTTLEKKDKILLAALKQVPFDGWSSAVLTLSGEECGYSSAEVSTLFQGGVTDLVNHFSHYADRKMREEFKKEVGKVNGIGQKVSLAVKLRFQVLESHKEAVRKALAFYSFPSRLPIGVHRVYETADTIWSLVGLKSTDFSFYTRRATLVGILTGTTFFWLADTSNGHHESWQFLQNRIAETGKLAKLRQKFSKVGTL
ncbi:MAG: COQ9 family protein [Rhodospirillales bacterium]|nr:COQ9 family protein [Rhodospirillales bacterium]